MSFKSNRIFLLLLSSFFILLSCEQYEDEDRLSGDELFERSCVDKKARCSRWADRGWCTTNKSHMQQYCCATCNFGGGDNDNDDDSGGGGKLPSLEYTGSTSKTSITESNAVDLTVGSIREGLRSNSLGGISKSATSTDETNPRIFSVYNTALVFRNAVTGLDAISQNGMASVRSVESEDMTIKGTCGGKATGHISVDDETGEFWGELSFKDYCDAGVTIDGEASFSGTIDLWVGVIQTMTLDMAYLSCSDAFGFFNMAGTLSISGDYSSVSITMDVYVQNGKDGPVFWIHNYRINVEDYGSYVSMTLSGRFYDPSYGYVTLSTQQAIMANYPNMVPESGVLLVVGKNGAVGGPTMARLTCQPSSKFIVEADTVGDGVFDWVSEELSWDDL